MEIISRTDWARVDALTDETIDYSDSSGVSEDLFKLMKKHEPDRQSHRLMLKSADFLVFEK